MTHKKFAMFDIDGTLFRDSLYAEVVRTLIKMGAIEPKIAQKIDDSYQTWKYIRDDETFWAYFNTLMSSHESQLPTLKLSTYNLAVDHVFENLKDNVYKYTKNLIITLKEQGYLIFAISGSQQEIIDKFCKYHGFDDWIGSVHEKNESNDAFTGNTSHTHLDKSIQLNSLVEKHGVSFEDSIGIGDTHGDLKALEMVQTPIAFNPNSKLYSHAKSKGWKLVFERKDVVISLEQRDGDYMLTP